MRHGSLFSLNNLLHRTEPASNDMEEVLNLVPQAALLVKIQTQKILAANGPALKLTGYSRAELDERRLGDLFAGWDPRSLIEQVLPFSQSTLLAPHSGPPLSVTLTLQAHLAAGQQALLLFEPDGGSRSLARSTGAGTPGWENWQNLVSAFQASTLEEGLAGVLQAGQALLGADLLNIYRAEESRPVFTRMAGLGPIEELPDHFSPQDLNHLRQPHLWTAGKRSLSSLHRAARSSDYEFLATAPLGKAEAVIGLVAAGGRNPPQEEILPVLQALAAALTGMLEREARLNRLEAKIQQQQSQLSMAATLEEGMPDGMVLLSPDLKVLRMNLAAEMMLGYATREVRGQAADKILIGTETLLPALAAAQQGSPTLNLGNVRLYRRSGEAFLAGMRTLPVVHGGRITSILVMMQDQNEQEQIRMHAQHLEQRAVLGEVTAIFAHEVRNPINNISTGLQLMAYNLPEDDPHQETIARLQQDCDRLTELMKGVLSFSRPTEYEMEQIRLDKLMAAWLERLHPRMARINVTHHFQAEEDCPPVMGNARALEQVFNNLMTNALQAMSETGGDLAVKVHTVRKLVEWDSYSEHRTYVEVSIADTGPGIPREMQERVFHPFFTTNRNGTGLGLAIAKRILTAHKGNIRLTSFPGGTIFYVEIPAVGD